MDIDKLQSEIFDLLVSHKDQFMTIDSIYSHLSSNDIKPFSMDNVTFYQYVKDACTTMTVSYKNIHRYYHTIKDNRSLVLIFSGDSIEDCYSKLKSFKFKHFKSCQFLNLYDDTLEYLDEVTTSNYYDFDPNSKIYFQYTPLKFLASCKEKDKSLCTKITNKLLTKYKGIIEFKDDTCCDIAIQNNNMEFLNCYHTHDVAHLQNIIDTLIIKNNELSNDLVNLKNSSQKIVVSPLNNLIYIPILILLLLLFATYVKYVY